MIYISEERKIKEGRGKGTGANYVPYVQSRDFNSLGYCSNPIDWKTGRSMEMLSIGEEATWRILRWQDDVKDIREQYPLDKAETIKIADKYGIKHPRDRYGLITMTTDLLVTKSSGEYEAYSVKDSRNILENRRAVEKLFIEKVYWVSKGIPYKLVFKTDIDAQLYRNICLVVPYYKSESVHDDASVLKHLIATKQIIVDMSAPIPSMRIMVPKYKKEIDLWRQQH